MSVQKFIVIKGAAGLGNRILALLTAILYAELTNRKVVVDWRDHNYSDNGENSFFKFFNSDLTTPVEKIDDSKSIIPIAWKDNLHTNAVELSETFHHRNIAHPSVWSKTTININKINYEENIVVFWSFTHLVFKLRKYFSKFRPDFINKSTISILRELYTKYLPLSDELKTSIESFCLETNMEENIGVHIRYTDKKSNIYPMLRKLDDVVKRNQSSKIFLASDNKMIIDRIKSKYQNVITFDKWLPDDNSPMHSMSTNNPARVQHGYDTLIEIYSLSRCKELILDTDSSFDYIVQLLSDPSTIVHDFRRIKWLPENIWHLLWEIYYKLNIYLKGYRYKPKGSTKSK